MKSFALAVLAASAMACGPGAAGGPSMNNKMASTEYEAPKSSVISNAILSREPLANTATVKHILISWEDLGGALGDRQHPRAKTRSMADAENQVKSLLGQLTAGGDFVKLMKEHSEDTGSAAGDRAFVVTPDAELVLEFRQLSLRLKVDEIGVCQSDFGFHIIKRLQ